MEDIAKRIIGIIKTNGYQAYFVGGCVRDMLIGEKSVDISTDALPDKLASIFKNSTMIGYGITKIIYDNYSFEISTFRIDGNYINCRYPDKVYFGTMHDDAFRRDFTINSLYYDPLLSQLVDLTNGKSDLDNKIIRCIDNPENSFRKDYLRMIRCIRFASNLNFIIEPATSNALLKYSHLISLLSTERIWMELKKFKNNGFVLLHQYNILSQIFPTLVSKSVEEIKILSSPIEFYPVNTA